MGWPRLQFYGILRIRLRLLRSTIVAVRERMACHRCKDVIGVYEPMVVLADGRVRETSLAREPGVRASDHECYHRACFDEMQAERPNE